MKFTRRVVGSILMLLAPCALAQGQGQQNKGEASVIRGKVVGYSSVSPALQKAIEAKYGKRPAPDPNSEGPNSHVGKHGFSYVSPSLDKKHPK